MLEYEEIRVIFKTLFSFFSALLYVFYQKTPIAQYDYSTVGNNYFQKGKI